MTPSEAQGARRAQTKRAPAKLRASATPPAHVQQEEQLEKQGLPQGQQKRALNTREGVLQKMRSLKTGNARHASAKPPSRMAQEEQLEKEGLPQGQQKRTLNTREGVLQKMRSLKTGNARRASARVPSHMAQEEQLEKQAPPPRNRPRPNRNILLQKLRNLPGGREMMEDAQRRGARIGMASDRNGFSLAWLNPFNVAEAEAQGAFSVTVDPSNSWYSSSPYAVAKFYGAKAGYYGSTSTYETLFPTSWIINGNNVTKPYISYLVNIPQEGWYIVNFEGYGQGQATLKHYAGPGTFDTVQTWSQIPPAEPEA